MNKATFYKSGKYFEYRFHLFGSQSGFLKVRKVLEYIAILLAINSHTLKRDISREVTPTPQKCVLLYNSLYAHTKYCMHETRTFYESI